MPRGRACVKPLHRVANRYHPSGAGDGPPGPPTRRSERSRSRLRQLQIVRFDEAVEARAGDTQDLGGLPFHPAGPVEDPLNVGGLGRRQRVVQGLRAPSSHVQRLRRANGEVLRVEDATPTQDSSLTLPGQL